VAVIEGTTSRELRERFVELQFVPVATEILARAAKAVAVGYVVAQYWADEADDAVHGEYVLFTDAACVWPPASRDDEPREAVYNLFPNPSASVFFDFLEQFPFLDDNGDAITAFASFCPEGAHQEMDVSEGHALVYVARRGPRGGVQVEERGQMIRPEWEDRFDVGFAREIADEEAGEQGKGRPEGFWARMIRRWGG
jgi:hypothetical protein